MAEHVPIEVELLGHDGESSRLTKVQSAPGHHVSRIEQVLELLGQADLDVDLEAAQQEGAQDMVELGDDVVLQLALQHALLDVLLTKVEVEPRLPGLGLGLGLGIGLGEGLGLGLGLGIG